MTFRSSVQLNYGRLRLAVYNTTLVEHRRLPFVAILFDSTYQYDGVSYFRLFIDSNGQLFYYQQRIGLGSTSAQH